MFCVYCILERRSDKRMNCKKNIFIKIESIIGNKYLSLFMHNIFFQPFWNAIHQNYLFALIKNILCNKGTVSIFFDLSDYKKEKSQLIPTTLYHITTKLTILYSKEKNSYVKKNVWLIKSKSKKVLTALCNNTCFLMIY